MRAVQQDQAATWRELAMVYEAERQAVERFVRRRVGSAHAEDVTAQVFEAAASAVAHGRCVHVTAPWLIGVAKHKVADHWRRTALHDRRRPLLVAEQQRRSCAPSQEERVADRAQVDEALRSLSPRQHQALALRYIEGRSVGDVAARLEISVAAAESLLARARQSFGHRYQATAA